MKREIVIFKGMTDTLDARSMEPGMNESSSLHGERANEHKKRCLLGEPSKPDVDCLVVGGGPAVLLAAVYLGRYRRRVRVIDAGASRAALIPESHNYPGFAGIGGLELLRRLRGQACHYGAELTSGKVSALRIDRSGTFVARIGDRDLRTAHVLLATGLVDHRPQVEGFGRDHTLDVVRFCPICDGYEFIDRRIAVLGDLDTAGRKALFLRTYSNSVFLFVTNEICDESERADELRRAGATVVGKLHSISCTGTGPASVFTEAGGRHEVDVIYPAFGCTVGSQLATALGAHSTAAGTLLVNEHQLTTVPNLYAAGDVVTDLHQLSVAFGHAAIAATDIHNQLPCNPRSGPR